MKRTHLVAGRMVSIGLMALVAGGAAGDCDGAERFMECGGCTCIRVDEREVTLVFALDGQDDDETPLCSTETGVVDLNDFSDWREKTAGAVRVELKNATLTIQNVGEENTSRRISGGLLLGPESDAAATTPIGDVNDMDVSDGSQLDLHRDGEEGASEDVTIMLNGTSRLRVDWNGCVDAVPSKFEVRINLLLDVGVTVPDPETFGFPPAF